MPENTLKTAGPLSARASKSLDAMRTHVTDAPRSDAAHQAHAANVVDCRHDCSRPPGSADL